MIDEKMFIKELYKFADEEIEKSEEMYKAKNFDMLMKHKYGETCFYKAIQKAKDMPKAGEWIPFKIREADEDEQHEYGFTHMMDCELPEDEEEIFVTYSSGYVGVDTFICEGYECYLDSNREIGTEAIAWMPLPEPYKGVEE